jgi:hypothetical protein
MASPDEVQRLLPWWGKLVHRVLIARAARAARSEVRDACRRRPNSVVI